MNRKAVAAVLVVGILWRLSGINHPIADWHSHRQADTASVTREYLNQGNNWLIPKYHDLSDVQSGKNNPQGYRMVEVPIYNWAAYILVRAGLDLIVSLRMLTLLAFVLTTFGIYFLTRKVGDSQGAALAAAGVYWLLPYNLYYSTVILPDPSATAFMIWSVYFFRGKFWLSALLMMISVLIKPFTAMVAFPVLAYWALVDFKRDKCWRSLISWALYAAVVLGPLAMWRNWIQNFDEGIPASAWLFNNSTNPKFPEWYKGYNLSWLNKMVAFRPSWWRWLFYERIIKMFLGLFGLLPFLLAFFNKNKEMVKFNLLLMAGILTYFVVVAQGNIQHDYYQILVMPFMAIIVGTGVVGFKKWRLLMVIILLGGWFYSWNLIKTNFVINTAIVEAGQKADNILDKNALVIAPYRGDTAFLYQTGRRGWPTEVYDINKVKSEYKDRQLYLVSINYDEYTNSLRQKYKSLFENNDFIILDLNNEK